MEYISRRQVDRIRIDIAASQKLTGDFYKEFKDFLDFLRQEEINMPWKTHYGYNMKYEGRIIGGITLLGGKADGDSAEENNHIQIGIATALDEKSHDKYLEGLPEDITELFMERINNKCNLCRPYTMCAKKKGVTISVLGKRYKNICCFSNGFLFNSYNKNMLEMVLINQGGEAQATKNVVPLDTVKALIMAAKSFVKKMYL